MSWLWEETHECIHKGEHVNSENLSRDILSMQDNAHPLTKTSQTGIFNKTI